MKIFKMTILFLVITFSMNSCGSDDDTPENINGDENLLVGTWKLTAINGHNELTVTQDGSSEVTLTDTELTLSTSFKVINDDNTYTKSGSYILHVTTTEPDGSTSERDDDIPTTASGTWSLTDTTVMFNPSSTQTAYEGEIITLNSTTLKYKVVTEITSGTTHMFDTTISTLTRQ